VGDRDEAVRQFLANPEKRGVVYGTLLGDATLTWIPPGRYQYKKNHLKCGKDGTCYIRVKHAADQKSLVLHKHEFMKEIAGKIFEAKPANLKWQMNYGFYTQTSLVWKEIYDEFYKDARITTNTKGRIQKYKRINRQILDQVTDRGLAWWIMDDGCYSYNKSSSFFRLSTQGYSKEENQLIIDWFKDKYNVKASMQKNASRATNALATYDSYVIYIGERNFASLRDRLSPFIIPSLCTKLGYPVQPLQVV